MNIKKHVDLDTLANVISAIPSNIFLKDTELKYVFSSHIWEQVDSGGDEDFDIYGKSDRDIRKDTANLDNVEASDKKIMETGIGTRYTIKSEVDGHIQYLELVKEPVKDNDGNVIGIVGLINDVTAVTEEISEMLENEKEYRKAMKKGAYLAYEVNLSLDILQGDLTEKIDGEEINLLDLIGMKAPCCYSEMIEKYAQVLLIGECQQQYKDYHNPQTLMDLYKQGERQIVREYKLDVNGMDGKPTEVWSLETILLMHNTKGEITAFFTINDITTQRKKEADLRLQLEENVKEAERIASMKSDFLANMSHEIRTPMNAVIGMSELALREDLPEAARDYVNQIKASSNALLNIINDILDFSKIESGKMDIIPDEYNTVSVIHDISGVLMNRIEEKGLELVSNINPNLPVGLVGDDKRLRQIVINLAGNAIKFTEEGHIGVDVDFDKISDDEIMLKVSVKDTGIGIKEEDFDKLFGSFQQVDSKRNRNIEGTGLGLAICSKLVSLMGGTIDVSSEYGKGSVFYFAVPQKVYDWTPSIRIKEKEQRKVVFHWRDHEIGNLIKELLDVLEVENENYQNIENLDAYFSENNKNEQPCIITDYQSFSELFNEYAKVHQDVSFVVVCGWNSYVEDTDSNAFFIKKPLSTIGLGRALNFERFHSIEQDTFEFDYIAPDAKILIVDDNEVNLAVAEGLVKPLQMEVVTANSGKQAIKLLETNRFDLIFMDHMMPEMDGVETTRIIRQTHPELKNMPIIALSANALQDAKEMFLSEGMDDFVAKPIEMKTITAKLFSWLPKEKIQKGLGSIERQDEEVEEKLVIADLDVDYAISMIGNQKLYLTILEKYTGNIKSKAEVIKQAEVAEDLPIYTVEVHALKSASKQIGAMDLFEMAAELEACGNAKDLATIHEKTDALLDKYIGYLDVLSPLFVTDEDIEKSQISKGLLAELLGKMLGAADELDLDTMEEIIGELGQYGYEGEEQDLFMSLKEATGNIDTDAVAEIIDQWNGLKK